MENTAKQNIQSDEESGPAPLMWYVLWAGAWLCSSAAHVLSDSNADALYSTARYSSLILIFAAMYFRLEGKLFLGILGVSAAATLFFFLVGPREATSSSGIFLLLTNAVLLLPLYLEALRSRGVEWQIAKDSALPALGLLMIGSFLYFVLQELAGLPRLTAEWIWLLGGTLWIFSAGLVARKYV